MKKMFKICAWVLCFCMIVPNFSTSVMASEAIIQQGEAEPAQTPVEDSDRSGEDVSPVPTPSMIPEEKPVESPAGGENPEENSTQIPQDVESPMQSEEPCEPAETENPEEIPTEIPEEVSEPSPTALPTPLHMEIESQELVTSSELVTVNYDANLISQVGSQGKDMCMAYTLAYCKTIIDGSLHTGSEYWQSGTGGMPEWAGYSHSGSDSKQIFLKMIVDQIDQGKPVGMWVTGKYRSNDAWNADGNHWVAVIGYRKSADLNNLNTSDFYIIDPGNCGYDFLSENAASFKYTTSNLLTYGGSIVEKDPATVVVDSGACGSNVKWTLYQDGTLKITGRGAMGNYQYYSPWYQNHRNDVKKVVVDEGVTSIGAYAFFSHYNLKSIAISSTVKTIEQNAFYGASNLDTIEGQESGLLRLPDTVERINDSFGYTGFKNVYLGGNLKAVGVSSFVGCTFEKITIAKNIGSFELQLRNGSYGVMGFVYNTLYIGKDVTADWWANKYTCIEMTTGKANSYIPITRILEDYVQKEIIVDSANPELIARDGVLYTRDGDEYTALSAPANIDFSGFPSDIKITKIGQEAFRASNISGKLTIPSSVTVIENGAFMECNNLNEVVLPSGLVSLGQYAFGFCNNLKRVNIPRSLENNIGYSAYNFKCFGNTPLETITFETGLEKIPAGLFHSCLLSSITIPDSVKVLEDNVFRYCTNLTSIDIPEGVEEIGYYCFGDSGVKSVTIPSTLRILKDSFYRCRNIEVMTIRARDLPLSDYDNAADSLGNPDCIYGYKNSTAHETALDYDIPFYDIETGELLEDTDYVIHYKLNGGSNNPGNAVGYNEGETVVFLEPIKENARFGGWFTENNVKITEVSGQSITVTAKWIEETDFWIEDIETQTYTGAAVKPEVEVYVGDTLLKENRDYTISYKNNTKANDGSNAKTAPTVTITGKGNYSGKETATFEILPQSIEEAGFSSDNIIVKYNGKAQKPVPAVLYNGKKLINKKDFQLEYPDTEEGSYVKEGTYQIKIKGIGNYSGERTVQLIITNNNLISKVSVNKIKDQTYTGEEIKPQLVVKAGKVLLDEGIDYSVSYENNIEIGTATAIITGMNSYNGEKRITFKIKGNLMSSAKINGIVSKIYEGQELVQNCELSVTVNKEQVQLIENKDYVVSYQKNIDAGTATIQFTGINGYSGVLRKTFKIMPYNIFTDANDKIKIEMPTDVTYVKGGSKAKPTVKFGETQLVEGQDYTLSYKNNTAVNDGSNDKRIPTVTIKGKGNFTGSIDAVYTIQPQNIERLTITVSDKTYQNKKNSYSTKFEIVDCDGKKLSAGKDYEKNAVYAYAEETILEDGTVRNADDLIGKDDILPVNTLIKVTVTGKGYYYGTITGIYRIVKADINSAKVTIPSQTYTGEEIKPGKTEMTVKMGKNILSNEDYEIVGYSNNIQKGSATVTIRGTGNYGGTKTIKFTIKARSLWGWWRR